MHEYIAITPVVTKPRKAMLAIPHFYYLLEQSLSEASIHLVNRDFYVYIMYVLHNYVGYE